MNESTDVGFIARWIPGKGMVGEANERYAHRRQNGAGLTQPRSHGRINT
jgi:hypothetical protein